MSLRFSKFSGKLHWAVVETEVQLRVEDDDDTRRNLIRLCSLQVELKEFPHQLHSGLVHGLINPQGCGWVSPTFLIGSGGGFQQIKVIYKSLCLYSTQ